MKRLDSGFPKGLGLLQRLTTPAEREERTKAREAWSAEVDRFLEEREAKWEARQG